MDRKQLIEELRWKKFPVLDDGFVCLVDVMGEDSSVTQAARISYGKDERLHVCHPTVEAKLWELYPSGGVTDYVDASGVRSWSAHQINEACEAIKQEALNDDRTLIRYLLRNRHTTPFEMAEIKLLIRIPMDAWRQMVRHRTACLAGDVVLSFDIQNAKGGKWSHYPRTVKDVHDLWHKGTQQVRNALRKPHFTERVSQDGWHTATELGQLVERNDVQIRNMVLRGSLKADKSCKPMKISGKNWHSYVKSSQATEFSVPMKDRIASMKLRMMDEETGEIRHTNIVDIWESGLKQIIQVEFKNGKVLKASEDHMCFTNLGWLRLKDAIDNGALFYCAAKKKASKPFEVPIKKNEVETWKQIPEYLAYEVSSLGRVRSYTRSGNTSERFSDKPTIKKITISAGRKVVGLSRHGETKTFHVHRLVLLAFQGPLSEGLETRHLDGNCWNNRLNNLAYGTSLENSADRMKQGGDQRLWSSLTAIKRVVYLDYEMTYDLEVAGPFHNFIAGGVVVHNSINEYSTRYTEAIDSQQQTQPDKWRLQSGANKQGSAGFLPKKAHDPDKIYRVDGYVELDGEGLSLEEELFQDMATKVYEARLQAGVAREQARKDLPLSTYTEAYWKCDLHNVLHFLGLRMHAHAQQEIREYATIIGEQIVKPLFPIVWEAFQDYHPHMGAMSLTRLDVMAISRLLTAWQLEEGGDVEGITNRLKQIPGWSGNRCRERDECLEKLKKLGVIQ